MSKDHTQEQKGQQPMQEECLNAQIFTSSILIILCETQVIMLIMLLNPIILLLTTSLSEESQTGMMYLKLGLQSQQHRERLPKISTIMQKGDLATNTGRHILAKLQMASVIH